MAAATAALLVLVLLLLRLDTLRDRVGWTPMRALRALAPYSAAVPVIVIAVLLTPWWMVLILIAGPALAIAAMALAD
ncbi:hypothetical protein EH165_02165 [Nakamurella antarctica]|uniref:Uncharacterized protein n=1 Tax=Nakamurella antarctica TaxID=1902245 RepID=A0A3G8ZJX1_9ACTN|nr:hypothetical protein [Nakamurella antarctica]AZI57145.1 hypothetical protein EH165_02165 [Nakamurella antarctica]